MKKCRVCGVDLLKGENWYSSHAKTGKRLCNICDVEQKRKARKEKKEKAVAYKGGKCFHCGGVFHTNVYDFHHINPENKKYKPAVLMTRVKWEDIKEELDKCILLCANCHRIEHIKED